jgi:peroxiredoxin
MEQQHDSRLMERLSTLPPGFTPDATQALPRLRQRHQASAARHRRRMWTASGVAIAGCCVLAFPSTRAVAARCVDACGELVRSVTKLPVQQPAPDFTLYDADGQRVTLSEFRGRVVLLNFWATWCPPCLKEIPWFMEFQRTYEGRGLVVLGVSMDEHGWDAVRPFIARQQVNYRIMAGEDELAARFGGIAALPTSFIIGRDGLVVSSHSGLVSRPAYEAALQSALSQPEKK